MLDGVKGRGHYVGTYCAWGVNNSGWWGEGEIKFFIDGDEWPTICGTGTEDYFCGAYNFDAGTVDPTFPARLHRVHDALCGTAPGDPARWNLPVAAALRPLPLAHHGSDPLRDGPTVTLQALGWRTEKENRRRYLPLQDDIASVAYWYQTLPTAPFPALPDRDYLEII